MIFRLPRVRMPSLPLLLLCEGEVEALFWVRGQRERGRVDRAGELPLLSVFLPLVFFQTKSKTK